MKAKKTMSKRKPKTKKPDIASAYMKGAALNADTAEVAAALRKKITEQVGEKAVKENPFVSSPHFVELMKGVAIIPKALLLGSQGPVEFMNALLSVMVTMTGNIPDSLWVQLRERIKDDGSPTSDFFKHVDAIRSYSGKQVVTFHEDEVTEMPAMTAKAPAMAS